MVEWLRNLHPVWQALAATSLTWGVTALGAGVVVLTRRTNRKLLDAMLGFSGGVMIAASFWSLLGPAAQSARGGSIPAWAVAAAGFLLGGACLWGVDRVLPHLHLGFETHGRGKPHDLAAQHPARPRDHDAQRARGTGGRGGVAHDDSRLAGHEQLPSHHAVHGNLGRQ